MKDHPSVARYARALAASSGIEVEDLVERGRDAVADAHVKVAQGRYDPHRASFDTYCTNAVYRRMCTAVARGRRRGWEEELDEAMPDERTPGPERGLLLAELIRELPSDARAIVDLVLGDRAGSQVDRALREGTTEAQRKVKRYIRKTLGGRLRRGDRAEAAFRAISDMLVEMG